MHLPSFLWQINDTWVNPLNYFAVGVVVVVSWWLTRFSWMTGFQSLSRLCSSGAQSPQATNIWSRATEKEKRSPVRALRFRLVWKPEMKRANLLKRNGTKQKKLPHAPALPLARKTKALIAQCNSISCVIYIRRTLFRLMGLACFACWFHFRYINMVRDPAFLSIERLDKASNWM